MRLFGEQGYQATSVAQIEEAAGLSPGSGSLYKHFRSKRELLEAGLDAILATPHALSPTTAAEQPIPERAVDRLKARVEAGFARLEQDRDVSRLLFRDLDRFPDLLKRFGSEEIARIQEDTAASLSRLAGAAGAEESDTDWEALAAALQGAVTHYWLLEDRFGTHPTGVSRTRFVDALVHLAALAIDEPEV
jgi:AcrR family transcriptional regulator